MSSAISAFQDFWATWGAWISLALIPTIITGLSLSPKTRDVATSMQKVWDGIKKMLDLLSLATHKDSPGTFKLPLKRSPLPPDKAVEPEQSTPDDPNPPQPPPPPAMLTLLIALSVSSTGCSWLRGDTATKIKEDIIDCTIAAVESGSRNLLATVLSILTGGSPNWKDQLEAFTKEFGRDAVGCALVLASQELMKAVPLTSEGKEPDMVTKTAQEGVVKASSYINEKKWTFAEAK